MSDSTVSRRRRQIETLRTPFAQAQGMPFADLFTVERLENALQEEGALWRDCLWTPALTLWAFLSQVSNPAASCRQTVDRVLAWRVARGEKPCSPQTDPYCKARQRLPESLLPRLTRETGRALHQRSEDAWLWKGRRVKIADGTTVSMPDTPANQAAYPQPTTQKPGIGFPLTRLVVVFCLACGSVLDAALAPYQGKHTGETSLLRSLEGALEAGDVLVVDRCFAGWFDLALWQQRGIDGVTRLHHSRHCDMRRGRRLGKNDHVVRWPKPARPTWMDRASYEALPATLELREVRLRVPVAGFRTRVVVVVTTLCDAATYRAADLTTLYRRRWHVELDLRDVKVTLGMDVLHCKSPAMVRKEIGAHLLVYNLIRGVMAQAAAQSEEKPRALRFKGALDALRSFAERLLEATAQRVQALYEYLWRTIRASVVGDRPNRVEPRARKRRPKSYPPLTKPRAEARKQQRQKR